jgi:hypothetical protein
LVALYGEQARKPVSEMREELASKYNFNSVDQLNIQETETFYEMRQVANVQNIMVSSAMPFLLYLYESNTMGSEVWWAD